MIQTTVTIKNKTLLFHSETLEGKIYDSYSDCRVWPLYPEYNPESMFRLIYNQHQKEAMMFGEKK